ncbi:P-loop containing nucleoside triphosphate hydrolase protein [Nemania sp. FL0031]|nr:P-loop containing nucleoside triphosphate hydrolase protein [Nemania sp. FL0031]
MENTYVVLTERALEVQRKTPVERVVIALASPLGSGKSTIAAEVVERINRKADQCIAAVLPMDDFHSPRRLHLDMLPNRIGAYSRRGIHWTYDADAILNLVKALHSSLTAASEVIFAPSFDHATKDPREDGIEIAPDIKIKQIATYMDDTWFVDVDQNLALRRVADRHLKCGLETNLGGALKRARQNLLPNGEEIRRFLIKPRVAIRSIEILTNAEAQNSRG